MNIMDALKSKLGQGTSDAQPPDPTPDFSPLLKSTQKRGGLPVAIVAQIQALYAKESQPAQGNTKAKPAQIEMNPGWGGKGR